ncbi:MFS transporter [Nocardioides euryhalodurans]|uniref:MFS transporter n=1 Tax=Nocardioides euryhalodurans TaxID=2518370 RepID=A0A4P7GNA6_9ACTN|nr:MFS transporter [Nocardioides euryhalodurans]QBR93678.1 MFS transporter [Nocardioides euryhalodurans]
MSPRRAGALVLFTAVVLVSVNLRPGASAVGPVLAEVRSGLGMGSGVAGALTGLPGLCFGIFGAMAVTLARRVGTTAGITLGLLAVTVGLLLRPATGSVAVFLLMSTVALAGMAVGNVLVPAWIKQHGGRHEVGLATVYGSGLVLGGSLGSLLTAPLLEATDSWQDALGAWGLVAALALPVWAWLAVGEHREDRLTRSDGPASAPPATGRITTSPTAVAMATLFAVQAMHAYIQFGWLPQIYRDAGLSATYAGALQALLSGITIIGGLAMPTVIARSRTLAPYVVVFGVLLAVGYLGLLVAPATVPWLWAVVLGVSGFAFPTVIALITARTRHPAVTGRLSGFVQPVGYLLAGLGPFAVGLVHDATGDWTLVLWLLAATAVPFTWAGLRASRRVFVDDELA